MVSGPSRRGDSGFTVLVIVGPLKKIVIEPEGGARVFLKGKVLFVFLNFELNLFFLPIPQNHPSSLLRLTKPFT